MTVNAFWWIMNYQDLTNNMNIIFIQDFLFILKMKPQQIIKSIYEESNILKKARMTLANLSIQKTQKFFFGTVKNWTKSALAVVTWDSGNL